MPTDDMAAPSGDQLPERKRARFWIRAAKTTPEEQLAFARKLEADGRTKEAMKQYKALVHNWHESSEAVEAQYAWARLLESRAEFDEAFDAYQYMADFFPGRFDHEDLLRKQLSLADQIRTQRHIRFFFLRGMPLPERALPRYENILKNAPEWEHADDAQFQIKTSDHITIFICTDPKRLQCVGAGGRGDALQRIQNPAFGHHVQRNHENQKGNGSPGPF